jgi:hypothetical protein
MLRRTVAYTIGVQKNGEHNKIILIIFTIWRYAYYADDGNEYLIGVVFIKHGDN